LSHTRYTLQTVLVVRVIAVASLLPVMLREREPVEYLSAYSVMRA
jgi:hypothetical protein